MTCSSLSAIPIRIESDEFENPQEYPNVRSILIEIQHGLKQFHQNGHKRIIDLGSIPMPSYERNKLLQLLGQGEVSIALSSLGESEIYETQLSAVWVIKHRDEQGDISAMLVEITRIPEIVLSQKDDIDSLTKEIEKLIEQIE